MSHTIHRLFTLFALSWVILLAACSEWDTHSVGTKFVPANSVVRKFTHPLYVEYSADGAKVWGPAADEVTAEVDGHRVSIRNLSDSLAIFAYGYAAKYTDNSSLTVESPQPFALYLTGLTLRNDASPVLAVKGPCHLVLSPKSDNRLFGALRVEGDLTLSSTGALSIQSEATCITAASLSCKHSVDVTLVSLSGDGICLTDGAMRSTDGNWTITAARNAIAATDNIHLTYGNYKGTAASGAFFSAPDGLLHLSPNILVASADSSALADTAGVAQTDSIMPLCQQQLVGITLEADSTYNVTRNSSTTILTKFTPSQTLHDPWVLFTNYNIAASDTLHFSK